MAVVDRSHRRLTAVATRCGATNRRGEPCGLAPIPGGTVCYYHGGNAPQVRRAAARRLLTSADAVSAELVRLATKAESEAVRLSACRDLLDRLGVGTEHKGVRRGSGGDLGGEGFGPDGDHGGAVSVAPAALVELIAAALERTSAQAERYWARVDRDRVAAPTVKGTLTAGQGVEVLEVEGPSS